MSIKAKRFSASYDVSVRNSSTKIWHQLTNRYHQQQSESYLDLWNRVVAYFMRWLGLRDSRHYRVLTGFVFSSYFQKSFHYAVYLHFLGKKNTGKSRGLRLLKQLSNNASRKVNEKPADIYRKIAKKPGECTLLIDEFQNYSKNEQKEILAILNSGNEQDIDVDRVNQITGKIESFGNFCWKAFSGIDEMPDTLSSRTFKIISKGVHRRYRARKNEIEDEGKLLAFEIQEWAKKNKDLEPFFSPTLFSNDRVYDLFVPLLSVAPNQEIKETLIELGSDMVESESEDESETDDNRVLETIEDIANERKLVDGDKIPISDIVSRISNDHFNAWVVGRIVKRLGFKRTRSNKQSFCIFSSSLCNCVISVISLDSAKHEDQAQNSRSDSMKEITQTTQLHADADPACDFCGKAFATPELLRKHYDEVELK